VRPAIVKISNKPKDSIPIELAGNKAQKKASFRWPSSRFL